MITNLTLGLLVGLGLALCIGVGSAVAYLRRLSEHAHSIRMLLERIEYRDQARFLFSAEMAKTPPNPEDP